MDLSLLIVDDNLPFLEAAGALLARDGLDVIGLASTATEAISRVEVLRPDVVLVDVGLAGESGFELAGRLLRAGRDEMPTVVLMSTHAEADLADLIAQSPAAGFVAKSQLSAAAIRQLIPRSEAPHPA